nr:unnamed protein product [Callosobruchus analis]
MVITRELRDEIKNSVSSCIASIVKEDDFFQRIAQKVTDSVIKTLEKRISSLEQNINEINLSNNNILADIKDETATLKSENDLTMIKIDYLEQATRLNNLRIFKLDEREGENLKERIISLFNRKSVWTYMGSIFVLKDNKRLKINNKHDLNKL